MGRLFQCGGPMELIEDNFLAEFQGLQLIRKALSMQLTDCSRVFKKFDGSGKLIAIWGSKGTFLGELNKPEDIAINDNTGEIFVTDTKNSRIQVFQLK